MSRLLTAFADTAHEVATTDRDAVADMILDRACKDAVQLLRIGQVTTARHRIQRVAIKADRILGHATGGAA